MSSRRHASLKPHLNQVRGWVEMGATDLWIAHQLGSTPASIAAFRQKHGLLRTGAERPSPDAAAGTRATRRAEPAPADAAPPVEAPKPRKRRTKAERTAEPDAVAAATAPDVTPEAAPRATVPTTAVAEPQDGDGERPKRRRGRRGGRGRNKAGADAPLELEGVFDHGEEGYGLWLDGAVRDAAVYRTHWRGQREIVVRMTPDEIVIRRAGTAADAED